jgi:hypothetical protein
MNCQFRGPAALYPVPTEKEAAEALELVWTLWRTRKNLAPPRNRTPNLRSFRQKLFYDSNSEGSPTGPTRHVGHQLAYCTYPGWLWWWRIWWNDDWQGKTKYSEKTRPSAALSTTNSTWPDRARTRAAAVASQRLTAFAMARPLDRSLAAIPTKLSRFPIAMRLN